MPKAVRKSRRLIEIASKPISRRTVIGKSLAAGAAGTIAWFLPGGLGGSSGVAEAGTCCPWPWAHIDTAMYCGEASNVDCCEDHNNQQTVTHLCLSPFLDTFWCWACCWGSCSPCDDRFISNYNPC